MVDKKSIDLLPKVLQTNTNRRFLNATLDQLIQEPTLSKTYGYIGRQDLSPAYAAGDPYVQENDSYSQYYQLEPGLVINKRIFNTNNFKTENAFNYVDLLNSITSEGGLTNNHDRLFANEYYNYEGFVDLDKLVNYGKYYWVPNGPKTLEINNNSLPLQQEYIISRPLGTDIISTTLINQNIGQIGYSVDKIPGKFNPVITLVRGGNYTFKVGQPGHPFYIQTEPGLGSGTSFQSNIIKSQVYGVLNNGVDAGTITFTVPKKNAQAYYETIEVFENVDIVSNLPYSELQGADYNDFTLTNSIDGNKSFETKSIILTNEEDDKWLDIEAEKRKGIWQIANVGGTIELSYVKDWPTNTRIFVGEGVEYGHTFILKDTLLNITKVPNITAPLDTLYYQDGIDPDVFGIIKLVDQGPVGKIDVNTILGRQNYTSPNGIIFTNGLKVKFTSKTVPENYEGNEYIIEGVGKNIVLVPYANLITPDPNNPNLGNGYSDPFEPYDTLNYDVSLNAPLRKDYIVINRASVDGNAWSRTNRWFHEDVIRYAETFGNPTGNAVLDNNLRAIRPIVEYDANLQLWNHASRFVQPVTLIDTFTTNINNQVEGFSPYVLIDNMGNYYSDNVALEDDTFVIFAEERYENTRNKIYKVKNIKPYSLEDKEKTTTSFAGIAKTKLKFNTVNDLLINMKVIGPNIPENTVITAIDSELDTITISSQMTNDIPSGTVITFKSDNIQVHLIPVHEMQEGEGVVAVSGVFRQNKSYYWKNNDWIPAQQKFSLNQNPLFDIFDLDNNSFGDLTYYPSSSFSGSSLFGYKISSSGSIDKELGFRLSYKNVGNIGDIQFENYYDTDTFTYSFLNADKTVLVNNGFVHEITDTNGFKLRNNWVKIKDYSKQYIQRKFIATLFRKNDFPMDIVYSNSYTEKNMFVFVNGKELSRDTDFILLSNQDKSIISLTNDLNENDVLIINIYGVSRSLKENYTLPKNLTENSENYNFESLTLGQIRNHLIEMSEYSLDLVVNQFGNNNLRDVNYKILPGKILQHSAGVHVAQLLFNNDTTNIIKSIDFSRKSYSRFKDRFFYLLSTMEFENYDDPRFILDAIMEEIVINSSNDQAFYFTNMIPYGINRSIENNYTVYDTNYRKFNLISPYNIENDSYKAILVYLNNTQLLLGIDYINNGSFITLTDSLEINIDDVVSIYEYADTRGCMVPVTPTKIGLYPKFTPEIFEDNTYIDSTVNIIQGHDGSKTVAFGDFRDNVILEFEKRIYNNISVDYDNTSSVNFAKIEPGAFRKTSYSLNEWTQLLSNSFLSWSGTNGINVFENNITQQNDAFSFNYSEGIDRLFGESVPGYWRGIYKYFYDTDRPHTHPWEMIGYTQKPDWWEGRYGPLPYTSNNLVLWGDMEKGLIYLNGTDKYVDERYVRPNLLKIIPVDEYGNLLAPISSLIGKWNQQTAGEHWRFGDQSPQETAWRRSSDYPFAVQIAWALASPAEYCGLSLNTKDTIRIAELDQIINKKNGKRKFNLSVTDIDQFVPGSNIWIRDRLADSGIDIKINFNEIFENYKLNLVYKTSGFTDKKYLQVIADQASPNSTNTGVLIPQENYKVVLTKSAPVSVVNYSAVVIQKGSGVFKVYGFDLIKPYFTIFPRRYNNNYNTIKISESSAQIFNDDDNSIQVIPYGNSFTTAQQVVDFLISYGSYLTAQGFIFDQVENNSTNNWDLAVKEFLYWLEQGWDDSTVISLSPAGTKIKFNSQFGIVDDLTNNFNSSRIIDSEGKSLQTKDYVTYREGTHFELMTKDTTKGIHLIDFTVVLYEHTLIFDNITVFNDVVYEPNLGNRQYRIKLNGFKTRQWDGSLYAPGFLINHRPVEQWMPVKDYYKGEVVLHKNLYYSAKNFIPGNTKFVFNDWHEINGALLGNQLIPNAAFNAQQFENFYDVDKFDVNRSADGAARNSTGFVPRNYLTNMGLDNISQHKFYLGMIREKGTQAAVNAFLRTKLPYIDNDVKIDEQWAIRLGGYGGVTQKYDVELSLDKAKTLNGAYIIELIDGQENKNDLWNSYKPKDLLIKPTNYNPNIFAATSEHARVIGQTGPVLIDEVATTVLNIIKINNISGLANVLGEGSRIWVGADKDNSWNVYRITSLKEAVVKIKEAQVVGNEIEFTCNIPHGLTDTDIIMIRNGTVGNKTKTNLAGFYRISNVANRIFRVPIYPNTTSGSGKMDAQLYVLRPVKFESKTAIANNIPAKGWRNGDKIWYVPNEDYYEVIENTRKWILNESLTPVFAKDSDSFGQGVDVKPTQDIMIVGAPGKETSGSVYVYRQVVDTSWEVIDNIMPDDAHASKFGYSLKYNDLDLAVVGAPSSNGNLGLAYIVTTTSEQVGVNQAINVDVLSSNAEFGKSVTTSQDGKWIAIGAPGISTAYLYKYREVETAVVSADLQGQDYLQIPASAQNQSLTAGDVKVRLNDKLLVPYVDYTLGTETILGVPTDDVVKLTSTPAFDDIMEITYENWYQYVQSVTNAESASEFGFSVSLSTDGSQLAVGSPNLSTTELGTTYSNQGAAYIYHRSIETFIADGETNSFELENTPVLENVYINGELTEDYTITTNLELDDTPIIGSIVTIESNNFVLLEEKTAPVLQTNLKFGYNVTICPTTCSLFVGAIGYNNNTVGNGAVYRYINTARLYGYIAGTKQRPSVTIGKSIRINGIKVVFTGTTSISAAQNINDSNIPGVTAIAYNNLNLVIQSKSEIARDKLKITSTDNSALEELGLIVFDFDQTILANSDEYSADFGSKIVLTPNSGKLLVGSNTASNNINIRFDYGTTTFDGNTTQIDVVNKRSGKAYLYEYQSELNETASSHGKYILTQGMSTNSLRSNDNFATGIALTDNWMMITALHSITGAGTVYSFYNKTGETNWQVIRSSPIAIDSRRVERLYLYNDNTKSLIAELPIIDPEHGLPVRAAAEQIKYIVNYDPAIYTTTPNAYSFSLDAKKSWGKEHVGELWWDTNALRYVDWYQGDLIKRLNNWGLTFPNSFISIYEWIESDVPPSIYAKTHLKDGPVYTVNDVYSSKVEIDEKSLKATTKYYFWVRNSNLNANLQKRNSALQLQSLISNPRNSNEPFAALLGTNALTLFNCQDIINSDTRLHITISTNRDSNPIHEEWSMFDDGSDLGVAVEFLERINDSLSGQDSQGRLVPDPSLTEKEKYGLGTKPRQTTFSDRFTGRKIWVENVNAALIKYPVTLLRDITLLQEFESIPAVNGDPIVLSVTNDTELEYYNKGFYQIGDQVVVENDSITGGWTVRELTVDVTDPAVRIWQIVQAQAYNLNDYWEYKDWYADGYSEKTPINKIINYEYELLSGDINIGDVVKIKFGANGLWKLVYIKENTLDLIAQQNATIQFKSSLYNNITSGFGIDTQSFEVTGFARDNSLEFRKIFEIINFEILNKELRDSYKQVVSALIDSIVSQFKNNDWLMKTSLINIKHRVRSLDQIPVYIKQPENIVTEFINEVKPYHTKIKQYLSSYDELDLAKLDTVDFDLPAYYNKAVSKYRQPQLGNELDASAFGLDLGEVDGEIVFLEPTTPTNNVYSSWYYDHKYRIEFIDILNGGSGYNYTSEVKLVIKGDGIGAKATAYIRNGAISNVVIDDPGKNYTYATVEVISAQGSGAKLVARVGSGKPRSIATTIKFDRFTYEPLTENWQSNTTYDVSAMLIYNNNLYRLALSSVGTVTEVTETLTTGSTFNLDNLIEFNIKVWEPNKKYAKDTIVVYNKVPYVALTDFTSEKYFIYNNNITVTHSVDWQPKTTYPINTIISYNSAAYKVAVADYESDTVFNETGLIRVYDLGMYPGGYFDDAASRVWAYYSPKSGMPGKELVQLMTGLEYPGVKVIGPEYDQVPGFGFQLYEQITYDTRTFDENGLIDIYGSQALDSVLFGFYNDAQLGIRTEDMITDGAGYLDVYNSHAPEEFIPGYMLDSLNIRVKTLTSTMINNSPEFLTLGIFADGATKNFSYNPAITRYPLPVGGVENIYVYNNFDGVLTEGLDYIIDWQNQIVRFNSAPETPSSIFITLFGASGINNVVDTSFRGDGVETKFVIADVLLENVTQAYIKVNGVKNTEWSLITDEDTGLIAVVFDNAPNIDALIQIHLFSLSISQKAYSEVINQSYTVPNNYVYAGTGYTIDLPEVVQYVEPFEPNILVRVNGIVLEPSNQAYYTANGYDTTFSLPTTRNIDDVNLITDGDITVVVNGITQTKEVDYTVYRNGIDIPSVVFTVAPARNSTIVVSDRSNSQFAVYYNETENVSKLIINDSRYTLFPANRIDVTVFSNHDSYDVYTQVFSGQVTAVETTFLGFDQIGFDIQGFETEKTGIITPVYTVARGITNYDKVIVTFNGITLEPYYDYIFATPTILRLDPQLNVSAADIIIVRSVSEADRNNNVEFRIFKGVTETYEYFGIGVTNSTRLAADLAIDDEWLYLDDIDVLTKPDPVNAIPGVLFVNGERITFWVVDFINNRVGQLRRATNGTGAPLVHNQGLIVTDAGINSEIPNTRDRYVSADGETILIGKKGNQIIVSDGKLIRQGTTWYTVGAGSASDGNGIENSNTIQANFLKAL